MTDASMRIGTAERHRAEDSLRDYYASGHLDDEDLETRLSRVLKAKTRGELAKVLENLPPSGKTLRLDFSVSTIPGTVLATTGVVIATTVSAYLLNSSHGKALSGIAVAGTLGSIAFGVSLFVAAIIAWCRASDNRAYALKEKVHERTVQLGMLEHYPRYHDFP